MCNQIEHKFVGNYKPFYVGEPTETNLLNVEICDKNKITIFFTRSGL